jgi:hypothetical protein
MERPPLAPERLSPPAEKDHHPASPGRRRFMGKMGGVAAAAASASAIGLSPLLDSSATRAEAATGLYPGNLHARVAKSFALRVEAATRDAQIPIPFHTTNGDEHRYPDKSGTYTKGLLQDSYGRVNLDAFSSMKAAFASGNSADFEKIVMGGTRTLNCPQGALAFDLEGCDSVQFGNSSCPDNQESVVVVPPPPAVATPAYGTELVELYWCSLLRDVAFTDYATNPTAIQATAEMSLMPHYAGPRNGGGQVTPDLLFRGAFPGETGGPYISQFLITPTFFGQQPINQQLITYLPGIDYMTDLITWSNVQNGIGTGIQNQSDPQPRYLRDGRGLAAYTHTDVLYQAYFTAFLVLNTLRVPLNPGNPYVNSKTQNGFCTFGGPDMAASLGEIASRSLDRVWYQKWMVHLRHRPESGGVLVHLIQTGQGNNIDSKLHKDVLNAKVFEASFARYGSYLLSQPFPEGSPTHPAYPTGHGIVGGACITLLKFFFDGNYVIPSPLVPADDGLSLAPYTGSDAGQITVNGELNKLAHNVSFGHGIHAGIHWRSDSDDSMLLGEAFAISMLQDKARTYNEKFTVSLTKLDGTIATISNQ